jgi:poly-beta-1,6-N-acetyl-D-glucosamine synthase
MHLVAVGLTISKCDVIIMVSTASNLEKGKLYVLVTAAYNEEKFIENLIRSVVAQTLQPLRWVIVSDGSTDRTDEIVRSYAAECSFIRLHQITEDHPRNFAAQVHAINSGFAQLRDIYFDFVGNLDADITLEPTYFSALLRKFDADPTLGLAGGYVCEKHRGEFLPRKTNNPESVAHAVQLFRLRCWEQLGCIYVPLPFGGPDWLAEVTSRMNGWTVKSFTDLPVHHHRPTGGVEGWLKAEYRLGNLDYAMGAHPLFELFKIVRRLPGRPYIIRPLVRLFAFVEASVRKKGRCVPKELVAFLRREEMARIKIFLRIGRGGGKVTSARRAQ